MSALAGADQAPAHSVERLGVKAKLPRTPTSAVDLQVAPSLRRLTVEERRR